MSEIELVPLCEATSRASDPRYAWMNRIQAVGRATFDAEKLIVHYPMIYELH